MTESRVTTIKGGQVLRSGFGHAGRADVLVRDREIVCDWSPTLPCRKGSKPFKLTMEAIGALRGYLPRWARLVATVPKGST
jgi:hypothetical protein